MPLSFRTACLGTAALRHQADNAIDCAIVYRPPIPAVRVRFRMNPPGQQACTKSDLLRPRFLPQLSGCGRALLRSLGAHGAALEPVVRADPEGDTISGGARYVANRTFRAIACIYEEWRGLSRSLCFALWRVRKLNMSILTADSSTNSSIPLPFLVRPFPSLTRGEEGGGGAREEVQFMVNRYTRLHRARAASMRAIQCPQ